MLQLMRKHARNWIMKILLGIIILVFVFYFGDMGRKDEGAVLAVIGDRTFVRTDFYREYNSLIEFYRRQFGPGLNEELIRTLNLRQQAFDNMIYKALAQKKIAEWGITVTDDELRQFILTNPAFLRDGAFDQRLYEDTLRQNRMTSAEFESAQRESLTIARLEGLLAGVGKVTAREINDLESLQIEETALEAIIVTPDEFARTVQPSRDDLEMFLRENPASFRKPEQFQLEYLSFLPENYMDRVKLTEEEIRAAITRREQVLTAATAKAKNGQPQALREQVVRELRRHQAFRIAEDEARKAYEIIYQDESLEKYAQSRGKEIRKTGFFRLDRPPVYWEGIADLPRILMLAQKGVITRINRNDGGFFIVRVVERREPYTPALGEIEKEVLAQYIDSQGRARARAAADDILAELKKGAPWRARALSPGMRRIETGFFRLGEEIPNLGDASREMNNAIFVLSKKNPTGDKWLTMPDGRIVIFYLTARRVQAEADASAFREAMVRQLNQIKRQEIVRSFIDDYKQLLIEEGRLRIIREAKEI